MKGYSEFYSKFKDCSNTPVPFTKAFLRDLELANQYLKDSLSAKIESAAQSTTDSDNIKSSQLELQKSSSDENSSFEYVLSSLKTKCFSAETQIKKPTSKVSLLFIKKKLCKSIMDMNIIKIAECLFELESLEITPNLLNSTKLTKVINYFIKSYTKCSDQNIKSVVRIAESFYLKWKMILISENLNGIDLKKETIRIPELRERVCNRIISILKTNGFETKDAEILAITIEGNIRKRDYSMKDKYIKLVRKMIKDIKLLDVDSYLRSNNAPIKL